MDTIITEPLPALQAHTGDVVSPSALTSLLHCPLCPRLTCCCCLISLFIRTLYPARASNTHTKSLTAKL